MRRGKTSTRALVLMFYKGLAPAEIAKVVGLSPQGVAYHLKKGGVTLEERLERTSQARSKARKEGKKIQKAQPHCMSWSCRADDMLELWHQDLTLRQIAMAIGCSGTTVSRYLKQQGITREKIALRKAAFIGSLSAKKGRTL